MRIITFALALSVATPVAATDIGGLVDSTVTTHILPGFSQLTEATEALKYTAQQECQSGYHPGSEPLQNAFHTGFDAWMAVSHLRFGPTEVGDRGFAMAYWPDTKGFTPKSLGNMISTQDQVVSDLEQFATTSIAGRGFFALEFLLFDEHLSQTDTPEYHCALIQAITTDIDRTADQILLDWQTGFAQSLQNPGPDSPYRSDLEAVQELFKALDAGLQFTGDTRLGRPLGSFDKPRPRRAEARRSGRSLRQVTLSLQALQGLAENLSGDNPALRAAYEDAFGRAYDQAAKLNDPVFAGVGDIQTRLLIEILQQNVQAIRDVTTLQLGPALGVSPGFNALDGD